MPMTAQTGEAARVERMFRIAVVPVIILLVASLYVRFTTRPDPLWTEFAMPLLFALLGARSIVLPGPAEGRKAQRGVGILLIGCAALILLLRLLDHSQGAN
jgi:hypothetical protein